MTDIIKRFFVVVVSYDCTYSEQYFTLNAGMQSQAGGTLLSEMLYIDVGETFVYFVYGCWRSFFSATLFLSAQNECFSICLNEKRSTAMMVPRFTIVKNDASRALCYLETRTVGGVVEVWREGKGHWVERKRQCLRIAVRMRKREQLRTDSTELILRCVSCVFIL